MHLQDAIDEYTDMLFLGSQALKRLIEQRLPEPDRARFVSEIDKIVKNSAQLKIMAMDIGDASTGNAGVAMD